MSHFTSKALFAVGLFASLFVWGKDSGKSGFSSEQESEAKKLLADKSFYIRGKGTPAQFITDQRNRFSILSSRTLRKPSIYAAAIRGLSKQYKEAEIGFNWKEPTPTAQIPNLTTAPKIDGKIGKVEWNNALCYGSEYPLENPQRRTESRSRWYVGWSDRALYVAAVFKDNDIQSFKSSFDEPGRKIYEGDSLEIFIRPWLDRYLYYECIVNPKGKVLSLMHGYNYIRGGHAVLAKLSNNEGPTVATSVTAEGFCIEMSIPFNRLYGFEDNMEFSFIMIRTNLDNKKYSRYTPVPFLYDGHNIFGYIKATLKKK